MADSKVYYADNDDKKMVAARQHARENFRYFWRELYWDSRRIVPGVELAYVKAAFQDGDIVEHMWIGDIDFDGYTISGELANDPNELTNVCQCDIVTVDLAGDQFTDWLMILTGNACGGYSIQEMRKKMSKKERKSHDDAWGIDFGDPTPKLPVFTDDPDDDHPMSEHMVEMFENFLTENPEEITEASPDGWTILHHEALAGNAKMLEVILRLGGDKTTKTSGGHPAFDLATHVGWTRVAEMLKP